MSRPILFLLLFLLQAEMLCQPQDKEISYIHQQVFPANPMYPAWSKQGQLAFQSAEKGKEHIFIYDHGKNAIIPLPTGNTSSFHPVWVPGRNAIVYDTGTGKNSRLFYMDLKTMRKKLLIPRPIACREASFTPSRHLVAFSGFDDRTQRWQIFTYDFIYDNLNRLTNQNGDCSFPVFSPDGKRIAYLFRGNDHRNTLKIVNWYGDTPETITDNILGKVSWSPNGWNILFVTLKNGFFSLSSIQYDGTQEREIYHSSQPLCCPVVNPVSHQITFDKKTKNGFHLETLMKPLE